jgi:release factor glutamine methyltransferase
VSENVLIPRPETEHIIDLCQKHRPELERKYQILDLCTGSGCIGLTLASLYKNSLVTLADICPKALEIARLNNNQLMLNAKTIESDFLNNITDIYDIILCNPPYIAEKEKLLLTKNIDFEPQKALFASHNGLYYYYKLAQEIHKNINKDSIIIIEAGFNQEKEVSSIFKDAGFKILEISKDLAGHFRNIVIGT